MRKLTSGVFTLVSWVLLVLLLVTLVEELFKHAPDVKLVTALVALILICALFAQHGSSIIPRVKRLGPVELFEESVPGLLSALESVRVKVRLRLEDGQFVPGPLTPEELYHYHQWDLYLSLFDLWGMDPAKIKVKERYYDLLTYVAAVAFVRKDWPRATARFERLLEASGEAYNAIEIGYNNGLAYYHWALDAEPAEQAGYYRRAIDNLQRVIAKDKDRYLAYYYLAYAHDELGNYGLAIEANSQALKIRPQFAPARYNTAISYVKLLELDKAYQMLDGLQPHQEGIEPVRQTLTHDQEIQPLRSHLNWRDKVTALVQRLNSVQ